MSYHHRELVRGPGNLAAWKTVRAQALERDDYTCMKCGVRHRSVRYEVHHLVPVSRGGDGFALDNLQTLCRECHFEVHRPKHKRDLRTEWEAWAREW